MTEIQTAVKDVTVFPDRARITRIGTVALEEGLHSVLIADLPASLEPASLRAKARGSARARLLGVDVRKTFFVDSPEQRVKQLEDRLQEMLDEQQGRSDQRQTLAKMVEHLDGLLASTRTYAYSMASGKIDPAAHAEMVDNITERRNQAGAGIREIDIQIRRQNREIEKIRRELEELRAGTSKHRYAAVIDFEVSASGELEVDLSYLVPGCGWRPLYDFRLLDEKLEMTYFGEVAQKTGENWDQVMLTLSTAFPALASVLPELDPWYLNIYRPPPIPIPQERALRARVAQPAPATAGMEVLTSAAVPEADEPVAEATAEIDQSGAAVTYRISGFVDIPGDGSTRKMAIASEEIPHQLDYISTPKLADTAYRRVKVKNKSSMMLLPGPTQLFEGDDYLGTSKIDLTSPGQDLELYFGADDRVRVERELVRRETDRRIIGDRRRIRFAYKISLENHTGAAQKLLVRDQIPLPRHEDIKVKLESSQPTVAKQDELNRLEWNLQMSPGTKQEIRFDFSVEYPRSQMVTGLP